jgi:hypothetical protein
MNRILFVLAFLLTTSTASAEVARSAFASRVGTDTLRAAVCSMHATVSIGGRARPLAMHVGYAPCDETVTPPDALSVAVHVEPGETRFVVLESEVPAGTDAEPTRTAVALLASDLAGRIARAMAPVTVVPSGLFETPSALELPPQVDMRAFYGAPKKPRDAGKILGIVLGSTLGGALVFTAIYFLLASGHGCCIGGSF